MLTPKPVLERYEEGAYSLPQKARIHMEAAFDPAREGICALLPGFAEDAAANASVRLRFDGTLGAEAYTVDCDARGVAVFAGGAAGGVHAAAALYQLLIAGGGNAIPFCHIEDCPRYAWRGMHLDVARHFFPVKTVRRYIDLMALYRMNRLHFHISDDQGYRIESKRFPLLNQVGSLRSSSAVKRGKGEVQDGVMHGGYYTKAEIRALVAYARARGIEIVPEVDIPGHTNALIASYPYLSCFEKKTEVVTEFGLRAFMHNILCAGEPKVYEFLYALLDELMELFPFPYFHIGGDEAGKRHWEKCPKCQALMREQGVADERELQGYMLERVREHLAGCGRRVILWNDALSGFASTEAIVQHWTPAAVESDRRTAAHLNAGGQAIMSGFRHLYFDYPYAMTPLQKTYEYAAMPRGVRADKRDNVLGIECCMWTEWIADERKLFFDLLPRLAAGAELGWTESGKRDYEDFVRRLPLQYKIYEAWGLPYAKGKERAEGAWKRLIGVWRFFFRDTGAEAGR